MQRRAKKKKKTNYMQAWATYTTHQRPRKQAEGWPHISNSKERDPWGWACRVKHLMPRTWFPSSAVLGFTFRLFLVWPPGQDAHFGWSAALQHIFNLHFLLKQHSSWALRPPLVTKLGAWSVGNQEVDLKLPSDPKKHINLSGPLVANWR